jgi:hypothetical protein
MHPRAARAAAFRLVALGIFAVALVCPVSAQQAKSEAAGDSPADPWAPLRLLEGTWEGAIDGRLGQGHGVRRYEWLFDGLYLASRHTSVRLPQEKSPQGDHHRELAVYSFDREREAIVLRAFMVEGYVLRYRCEVETMSFVCTTEEVESGAGMRGRLTVTITDRYRFEERFELASPGQDLQLYFTNRWTRVPDLADWDG